MVFAFNILDQIIKGQSLILRAHYTIPFLILTLFIFLKNPKQIFYGYVFSIIAIFATFIGQQGNTTGLTFIIFSAYIFRNKAINIIILFVLSIIAIAAKAMFLDFSIGNTLNIFVAYSAMFIIYYILIHPKNKIHSGPEIICTELEQEDIQILQYLSEGLSIKEISDKIYISPGAINKRIGRAKETMQAKSREHLLIICIKKRFIRVNIDK